MNDRQFIQGLVVVGLSLMIGGALLLDHNDTKIDEAKTEACFRQNANYAEFNGLSYCITEFGARPVIHDCTRLSMFNYSCEVIPILQVIGG